MVDLSNSFSVFRANPSGETAFHLAASNGLSELTRALLSKDLLDPNVQTVGQRDTALHLAIANRHLEVIKEIIDRFKQGGGRHRPDMDLKNSRDQTPLSLALSQGLHDIAMDLIKGTRLQI
jgi:ankyrin repeat protein